MSRGTARLGVLGGNRLERGVIRSWLESERNRWAITDLVVGRGDRTASPPVDLLVALLFDGDDATLRHCRNAMAKHPHMKLVAIIHEACGAELRVAARSGATGLVASASGAAAAVRAVKAVIAGHAWVDPSLSGIVIEELGGFEPRWAIHGLTAKEGEVARGLLHRMTNRDLAADLGIGSETVKSHLHNIYRKLGVGDRHEAIARLESANRQGTPS